MINYEYIDFTYSDRNNFDLAKNVYDFLKTSRQNDVPVSDLTIFPESATEYFKNNDDSKGWKLKNLIEFLKCDLDVTFIDIVETEEGKGCLTYESHGYPYGGPESLITLLQSMSCLPTKVFEGAETYSINWLTEYDFVFDIFSDFELEQNSEPEL